MEGHGDACQQVNHRLVASDLAEKEAKGRDEARAISGGILERALTMTCEHRNETRRETNEFVEV